MKVRKRVALLSVLCAVIMLFQVPLIVSGASRDTLTYDWGKTKDPFGDAINFGATILGDFNGKVGGHHIIGPVAIMGNSINLQSVTQGDGGTNGWSLDSSLNEHFNEKEIGLMIGGKIEGTSKLRVDVGDVLYGYKDNDSYQDKHIEVVDGIKQKIIYSDPEITPNLAAYFSGAKKHFEGYVNGIEDRKDEAIIVVADDAKTATFDMTKGNFFTMSAEELTKTQYCDYKFDGSDKKSAMVILVTGENPTFNAVNQSHFWASAANNKNIYDESRRIIWVFTSKSNVNLASTTQITGAMLAPYSTINFLGSSASNGTLVAKNVDFNSSSNEIHWLPFMGKVTLEVEEPTTSTGDLVIKNIIDAPEEKIDKNKEFEYKVSFSDKTLNGTYGEIEIVDGEASFTLKHNESKKVTGLPDGTEYVVLVKDYSKENYVTYNEQNKGVIVANTEKKVEVIHTPSDPGEEPGNPGEEPGNPGEEPGNPGEEPGNPGEEPGNPGEEPGNPGEEPGNPGEEPGNPGEEPGNPGEEPGNPTNPIPGDEEGGSDITEGDQNGNNPSEVPKTADTSNIWLYSMITLFSGIGMGLLGIYLVVNRKVHRNRQG